MRLVASIVVVFVGVLAMIFCMVRRARLRQAQESVVRAVQVERAIAEGLRKGESIGRMTVVDCGEESVLLSRVEDPRVNGWIRLGLAAASMLGGAVAWWIFADKAA